MRDSIMLNNLKDNLCKHDGCMILWAWNNTNLWHHDFLLLFHILSINPQPQFKTVKKEHKVKYHTSLVDLHFMMAYAEGWYIWGSFLLCLHQVNQIFELKWHKLEMTAAVNSFFSCFNASCTILFILSLYGSFLNFIKRQQSQWWIFWALTDK